MMNKHPHSSQPVDDINQPPTRLIWLDHFGIDPEPESDDPEWDEIIPYEPTEPANEISELDWGEIKMTDSQRSLAKARRDTTHPKDTDQSLH